VRPPSRAAIESDTRHLSRDHHARALSAISALTATFHFSRGPGDLPTQTGRSRGACEQQASLWEESLPLSPGQLGSIPYLYGDGAGDYLSLAEMQRFEPSDDLGCTMQIAMLINCFAQKALTTRLHLGCDSTRVKRMSAFGSLPAPHYLFAEGRDSPIAAACSSMRHALDLEGQRRAPNTVVRSFVLPAAC
jgi:hypothetical protein